ncbi:MAG: sensor histidine kinase, partial [Desulfovibrionaceae bacterium]
ADQAVITVADQGQGISPRDLKHIFDPFFTTKRDSGGTGLGLSVSHGIIQEHGGAMTFSSSPGRGTVCTIRLPLCDPEEIPQ